MTLCDILVAFEFSNVFLDELPSLPLDRDVEFRIELVPGTAPISRRPYRMPPNELLNSKYSYKSFSTRVSFDLVHLHGVVQLCL